MRPISIRVHRLHIMYDTNYGCDHRNGWGVDWDGSVLVQLYDGPFIVALCRAIKWICIIEWEMRGER